MKYHVLVVEDEATLLHGIMSGLQKMPTLHVNGCSTAEEAADLFRVDPPDLMVTDLHLPGASGIELISQFKQRYKNTPVVVTTAFRANYDDQLSMHEGVTVLEKPVSIAELRNVVEDRLSRHSAPTPIGPFHLVDYLQLAGYGRYSLILQVDLKDNRRGVLEIVEGDIWNVYLGQITGQEALNVLMGGEVRNLGYMQLPSEPVERQIHRKWEDTLLDMARIQDESSKKNSPFGSNALEGSGDLWECLESDDRILSITDDDLSSFASYDRLPQIEQVSKDPDQTFRELLQAFLDGRVERVGNILSDLNKYSRDPRLKQPWIQLLLSNGA